MTPGAVPTILADALAAHAAGLCIVRASADGTKRPMGGWKDYQTQRPSRAQVEAWFADGWPGMGAITGHVSGDLELLELEGAFMASQADEFVVRIKAAGLELLWRRLLSGFCVISPSGGRHLLIRLTGSTPEGNTKLAMDAAGKTLIETRGEGGFVVLAPSHGTVHPSGKPWTIKGGAYSSIPSVTGDERGALFDVARSFDIPRAAPRAPQLQPSQHALRRPYTGGKVHGSWMDAVVAHLAASGDMQGLLERYGWEFCYTDSEGRHHLRRPGKQDDGTSGSVNLNDRLLSFSSSVPIPHYRGERMPQTFDQLDVIAAYEYGGVEHRQQAAKAIAVDVGIIQPAVTTARPANVNADGEISDPVAELGAEFWEARPWLGHVHDAARSRLVAPAAVLGAVLARVAAFTPPSTCLPPLVGTNAPLSLYVALRGSSGAGKSTPLGCAHDLLPITPAGCVGPLALGSGEGLVEAFQDMVDEEDANGKRRKVKRQVFHGALFSLDEGQMLAQMSARNGSTIMPVLRTAWSGGDPGQANASVETRRSLKAGSYNVGLISLWQDTAAAALLADEGGGTPQRFVWFITDDPGAQGGAVEWPGELTWSEPPLIRLASTIGHHPMDVAPSIKAEVRANRLAVLRKELIIQPLDAHRTLNRLKLAGLFAVMDYLPGAPVEMTEEHWWLAEQILAVSDAVRNSVIASARRSQRAAETAGHDRAIARESVSESAAFQRSLNRAARAVASKVQRSPGTCTLRDLRNAIASRDRSIVSWDAAVLEAQRLQWIIPKGDSWTPGKVGPL